MHIIQYHPEGIAAVVQWLSQIQLFAIPWTAARQASLSFAISQSLLKLIFIESMIPSSHLILCRPLLLLPSVFPSISPSGRSCSDASDQGQIAAGRLLPPNSDSRFNLPLAKSYCCKIVHVGLLLKFAVYEIISPFLLHILLLAVFSL